MTQSEAELSGSPCGRVRLHRESHGQGAALLLMHGFSGSARNFRPQARSLAERHRVLLFDARGHARSEAPDRSGAYAMECFVADALEVLDAAGVERAVVGGLSMGAAVALALACAHPERVRALVLVSIPAGRAGGADPPGPEPRGGISAHALEFADAIEREGLDAAGARFVWGPGSGLDARGAALVRQGFLEHSPSGLIRTLRELLAVLPEPASQAAALAGPPPTLVVAGERDRPSLGPSRALAEALTGARLAVLPDAGHVLNLEKREAFDALLLDFLASLEPDPAAPAPVVD